MGGEDEETGEFLDKKCIKTWLRYPRTNGKYVEGKSR
jgi:hypothetical protein